MLGRSLERSVSGARTESGGLDGRLDGVESLTERELKASSSPSSELPDEAQNFM